MLMKMEEIRQIAKKNDIKPGKMRKVDLIRTIQTKEGNNPCFQTGINPCDQSACWWRNDCIEN